MKNKFIGREVQAKNETSKPITGIIIDTIIDDNNKEWYKVYESNGTVSTWDFNELIFSNSDISNRKESYCQKINHLQELTSWDENDCENFINLVYRYLDSCGYFHADYNIHGLPTDKNEIKYIDRDFGTWLLDMAIQYNMEQGKEYYSKLVEEKLNN